MVGHTLTLVDSVPAGSTVIVWAVNGTTSGAMFVTESAGNAYEQDHNEYRSGTLPPSGSPLCQAVIFSGYLENPLSPGDTLTVSDAEIVYAQAWQGIPNWGFASPIARVAAHQGATQSDYLTYSNVGRVLDQYTAVAGPGVDGYRHLLGVGIIGIHSAPEETLLPNWSSDFLPGSLAYWDVAGPFTNHPGTSDQLQLYALTNHGVGQLLVNPGGEFFFPGGGIVEPLPPGGGDTGIPDIPAAPTYASAVVIYRGDEPAEKGKARISDPVEIGRGTNVVNDDLTFSFTGSAAIGDRVIVLVANTAHRDPAAYSPGDGPLWMLQDDGMPGVGDDAGNSYFTDAFQADEYAGLAWYSTPVEHPITPENRLTVHLIGVGGAGNVVAIAYRVRNTGPGAAQSLRYWGGFTAGRNRQQGTPGTYGVAVTGALTCDVANNLLMAATVAFYDDATGSAADLAIPAEWTALPNYAGVALGTPVHWPHAQSCAVFPAFRKVAAGPTEYFFAPITAPFPFGWSACSVMVCYRAAPGGGAGVANLHTRRTEYLAITPDDTEGELQVRRSDHSVPPFGVSSTVSDLSQPCLCEDADERLRLLGVADDGSVRECVSDDDGASWSDPTMAFDSGTNPQIRCHHGYILRAVYVDNGDGTGLISAVAQEPGEESWGSEFVICDDSGDPLPITEDGFSLSPADDDAGRWLLLAKPAGESDWQNWQSWDDGRTFTRIS